MFFQLSTVAVAAVLIVIVGGAAVLGTWVGHGRRFGTEAKVDSLSAIQGPLLGLVGLLLAFGLTMSVGRYESRRALVVQEANDIGTTFLRAQLLDEPIRTASLELLARYGDAAVDLADDVPDSRAFDAQIARIDALQRDLWARAGEAVRADPLGTAPRLYVETLNAMIDTHTSRVSSVRNRVPDTVILLQVLGGAVAVGLLSVYLAILGRHRVTALVTPALVILVLFFSLDLDRPQRGFITVPFGPLVAAREAMDAPPAVRAP